MSDHKQDTSRGPFTRAGNERSGFGGPTNEEIRQAGPVSKAELERLRKERDRPVPQLVPGPGGSATERVINKLQSEHREANIKYIESRLGRVKDVPTRDFALGKQKDRSRRDFSKVRGRER